VIGKVPSEHADGAKWDPQQYLKFSGHRLRPAIELLDRVPLKAPGLIYDLGCGTGQVTTFLAERWPEATVNGLDNSKEMLERAKARSGTVGWIEADIEGWIPDEKPDLIYANASLHWVQGHQVLFPRLVGFLQRGGCLAVQMPLSWGAPSHRLMRETLADGGGAGKALGTEELRREMDRNWVEEPEAYYDMLSGSTKSLDIWESEYFQVLEGPDPVLEWVKGTGLRPIFNGLGDQEREIFLVEYARRLSDVYKTRSDGRTLYPFRRLFLVARV
jgi:trans-aconitate 2-methyltransferase